MRARKRDRNFPVVARHVPIQFIVIFEKSQRIQHAIVENYGVRRIVCIRNVNLKFDVASFGLVHSTGVERYRPCQFSPTKRASIVSVTSMMPSSPTTTSSSKC